MNFGYCCINLGFSELPKKQRITTNRSMIKRTFQEKGIAYASELALQNCADLLKIVKWNEENNIRLFRVSSDVFPWASEYNIKDLPDYEKIVLTLEKVGEFVDKYNHRITSHPGPFVKLTSPKEGVIQNSIRDLEIHGEFFDLMNLSLTRYNKINIHLGAHYNDKSMAIDNFCKNFERLSESVQSRLTVENDDKASLYSAKELVEQVYSRIGTPIVFDYHHHKFCTGDLTEKEALDMVIPTWGNVKPVVHYSQGRDLEQEDSSIKPQAHSDYYWEVPVTYGHDLDIMLEAKAKEKALMELRKMTNSNPCRDINVY
jgi:UV DNA damage endonuclease